MSRVFHVECWYEAFDDEPNLTADDLADRLRRYGFDEVEVVEEES